MPRLVTITRGLTKFSTAILEGVAWPYFELAMRLWLAKLFFTFGMFQLMHWQDTLALMAGENLVAFLPASTAAFLSTAIDLDCAALLAIGLMTRYAAVPLLTLSVIAQLKFAAYDTQLFWVVLFGWFAIHGAGPISMDRLLRRGLRESAFPIIPRLIRFSERLRRVGVPIYVALLRLWLGMALMLSSVRSWIHVDVLSGWLPLDVAERVPSIAAVIGGFLLVTGAGTRYVAVALSASLFAYSMLDPRMTDSIYLLMELTILGAYGAGYGALDGVLSVLISS